jgi:hypothetical protein
VAECSQDGPVGMSKARSSMKLSLEDPDLVPENEDLDVPVGFTTAWSLSMRASTLAIWGGRHSPTPL